jgi:hypothetical protein
MPGHKPARLDLCHAAVEVLCTVRFANEQLAVFEAIDSPRILVGRRKRCGVDASLLLNAANLVRRDRLDEGYSNDREHRQNGYLD